MNRTPSSSSLPAHHEIDLSATEGRADKALAPSRQGEVGIVTRLPDGRRSNSPASFGSIGLDDWFKEQTELLVRDR